MDFTICEHRLFNTRSFDLPLDKTPENLFLKRRLKKEEKSKFNETFRVPSFSMERAD